MHRVLFAVVFEADGPQHQVGKQVQQADERSEHPGHGRNWLYSEQDDRFGALESQDLWHLLAQGDMEEGDHHQRQDGREGVGWRRDLARWQATWLAGEEENSIQCGLDQLRKGVLADPPQQQAGDGYAQLGTRDESGGVLFGVLNDARGTVARRGELVDTRHARRNQREFRGDEEPVGRDQEQDYEESSCGGHVLEVRSQKSEVRRMLGMPVLTDALTPQYA